MSIATEYNVPVNDATAQKLAGASKQVKTVFDVFAVLIIIATVLATVGLFVAAIYEHNSYINDFDNYYNETGDLVAAAIIAPLYGAFLWASVKFYAVIAGYVHWRTK